MVECQFIYRFAGSGTSDSLVQSYPVHAIPKAGDKLQFSNNDGNASEGIVLDVLHAINTDEKTHKVVVFYGNQVDK